MSLRDLNTAIVESQGLDHISPEEFEGFKDLVTKRIDENITDQEFVKENQLK